MSFSSDLLERPAAVITRLFHAHDQVVLHPDVYFPDACKAGVFIPSAAGQGPADTPDEIYNSNALVPDPDLLFEVLMAGRSTWQSGDQFIRRNSHTFSVELVTHGQGELVVGRKHFALQPGDVFVLHPHERHVYRACSPEPFRKLFLVFDIVAEVHHRALELTGLQKVSRVRLTPATTPHVQALMERIISALRDAPADAMQRASLAAYELIILLGRAVRRHEDRQQIARQIEAVVQHVLDHLHEPLKVAQLARVVHTSPDYLNRLFIKHLGLHAHEWLVKLRMRVAAEMLCKTPWKVHEVAEQVGYEDAHTFTRTFKHVAGVTPKAYRLRAWKTR
ncbi:MAG: AraC family transcriptional regulator [bacterium]|nr:AraC family transcriptional regulator [bacterium]